MAHFHKSAAYAVDQQNWRSFVRTPFVQSQDRSCKTACSQPTCDVELALQFRSEIPSTHLVSFHAARLRVVACGGKQPQRKRRKLTTSIDFAGKCTSNIHTNHYVQLSRLSSCSFARLREGHCDRLQSLFSIAQRFSRAKLVMSLACRNS